MTTEEEAREIVNRGQRVSLSLGARRYQGNLFFGKGNSYLFLGNREDKPTEEIIARVGIADLCKIEAL